MKPEKGGDMSAEEMIPMTDKLEVLRLAIMQTHQVAGPAQTYEEHYQRMMKLLAEGETASEDLYLYLRERKQWSPERIGVEAKLLIARARLEKEEMLVKEEMQVVNTE